ncbi:single stranded DNA-binding domain-containing protein [Comamonas badia]|jgi:hypothetical protein|uniref:single-stranded DNA-binding protein n=1 Tax=Comamonas badia TaxID=265291 RepID=UPI0004069273|nr:single-stranded DNA-binding protein [Comamonas badia]
MIDALIAGTVYGKPQERTGKNGRPFVTCKLRAADGAGESHFINAVCFSPEPCAALLALSDGESVALSGTLTPKPWADKTGAPRVGLDLLAHAVLSAYNVSRKRKAAQATDKPQRPRDEAWQAMAQDDGAMGF